MTWILWALLLVIQNASFTLVSRARQGGNYYFHSLAAAGSNGIWFASQFIIITSVMETAKSGSAIQAVFLGLFYTVFTIIGSVGMHYISQHHIEPKVEKPKGPTLAELNTRMVMLEDRRWAEEQARVHRRAVTQDQP